MHTACCRRTHGLARYEGKLQANGEASAAEIRLILASHPSCAVTASERHSALVCLLSASEGWRDAYSRAGGAFAGDDEDETGLKSVKEG